MSQNSCCKLEDKGKSCCSSEVSEKHADSSEQHWNQAYLNSPEDQLGWYETDYSPSLRMIHQCSLEPNDAILLVGTGTSRLPDILLENGQENLIATDISSEALTMVEDRLGNQLSYRLGDILEESTLENLPPIKFWIDRAVLHFFTEEKDQKIYFDQVRMHVVSGGYVLLAEFNLQGADNCSGLPVHRYDAELLSKSLGEDFTLIDSFDWIYTMPSGQPRPYMYALFQRKS